MRAESKKKKMRTSSRKLNTVENVCKTKRAILQSSGPNNRNLLLGLFPLPHGFWTFRKIYLLFLSKIIREKIICLEWSNMPYNI